MRKPTTTIKRENMPDHFGYERPYWVARHRPTGFFAASIDSRVKALRRLHDMLSVRENRGRKKLNWRTAE